MTEAPKIGFLCTGKTPLELAVSIHCQSKMSPVLTEAGYAVGGCYTEIFDGSGPEKIKRAGKTLEYLCRSNDAVFTLGCEGFSAGDVIPELTEVVCTGSASYFTAVLCGAKELSVADKPSSAEKPPCGKYADCGRLYSDESRFGDSFRPRTLRQNVPMPFAEKLRKALGRIDRASRFSEAPANMCHSGQTSGTPSAAFNSPSRMTNGSAMRIFAGLRDRCAGKDGMRAADSQTLRGDIPTDRGRCVAHTFPESSAHAFKMPPSRARAGLLDQSLLLNFSNDADTVLPLLKALLPAIGFSVFNLSGKSAASYANFEKTLKKTAGIDNSFEFLHTVNE